jgi:hypothetical protein
MNKQRGVLSIACPVCSANSGQMCVRSGAANRKVAKKLRQPHGERSQDFNRRIKVNNATRQDREYHEDNYRKGNNE